MTRREILEARLAEFERGLKCSPYNGMMMATPRQMAVIRRLRAQIEEAREYEARPIRELMSLDRVHELGLIPMILECHIAADFLNDCSFQLESTIRKAGFEAASIVPELKEVVRLSGAVASKLCEYNQTLSDFITDDVTLIEALHKKSLSYIMQRIKKDSKDGDGGK